MKKLTKEETVKKERLVAALRDAAGKVEDEIDALNAKLNDELLKPINAAIEKYNEAREEAEGFVTDLVSAMDDFASEKSEKWTDGEAGQAFESWKDAYESISLDEVEEVGAADIFEIQKPEFTGIDDLDNAPAEVE